MKRAVSRAPAETVGLTTCSYAGTSYGSPGATNVVGTTGIPADASVAR